MRKNKIDYPVPMLADGRDDYVDCSFLLNVKDEDFIFENGKITVTLSYELICEGIRELISENRASVFVIFQSSFASFRRIFEFPRNETQITVSIPQSVVKKEIEITAAVIAKEDITDYYPKELNSLYYSGAQEIKRGDMTAKSRTALVKLDDSELEKPLSSIFSISCCEDAEDEIVPDFNKEKIQIMIPKDTFDAYYKLRDYNTGSIRRYLAGIVVYPILIEAIDKMTSNEQCEESLKDDVMSDRRWYRAIEKKLKEINVDLSVYDGSSASLANKLFNNVVNGSLINLKELIEEEFGGQDIVRIGDDE